MYKPMLGAGSGAAEIKDSEPTILPQHDWRAGTCPMSTERPGCGLGSLLSMSCRGRAEAFARRLHSRLQTLGRSPPSTESDATVEDVWLPACNSSDSDLYFDFDLDSPSSPPVEEELTFVVNPPRTSESGNETYSSNGTSSGSDSTEGAFFDLEGEHVPHNDNPSTGQQCGQETQHSGDKCNRRPEEHDQRKTDFHTTNGSLPTAVHQRTQIEAGTQNLDKHNSFPEESGLDTDDIALPPITKADSRHTHISSGPPKSFDNCNSHPMKYNDINADSHITSDILLPVSSKSDSPSRSLHETDIATQHKCNGYGNAFDYVISNDDMIDTPIISAHHSTDNRIGNQQIVTECKDSQISNIPANKNDYNAERTTNNGSDVFKDNIYNDFLSSNVRNVLNSCNSNVPTATESPESAEQNGSPLLETAIVSTSYMCCLHSTELFPPTNDPSGDKPPQGETLSIYRSCTRENESLNSPTKEHHIVSNNCYQCHDDPSSKYSETAINVAFICAEENLSKDIASKCCLAGVPTCSSDESRNDSDISYCSTFNRSNDLLIECSDPTSCDELIKRLNLNSSENTISVEEQVQKDSQSCCTLSRLAELALERSVADHHTDVGLQVNNDSTEESVKEDVLRILSDLAIEHSLSDVSENTSLLVGTDAAEKEANVDGHNRRNEFVAKCSDLCIPEIVKSESANESVVMSKLDDFDDDDDDHRRVRRCSSLKTGKTPPGTPGRKKIVRFADVLGLDLADVRTFLDEVPRVPSSAYQDLFDADLSLGSSSVVPTTTQAPGKCLVPMFQQPGGQTDFLERVRTQQVCLESASVSDTVLFSVTGIVRVRNLDFNKSVHIRYSLDGWKTFADLQATYVPDSCDGFADRFSFVLFAHTLVVGQRLEFAARFQCRGAQYWDSNRGTNYAFQCLPPATPYLTLASPEERWTSFY